MFFDFVFGSFTIRSLIENTGMIKFRNLGSMQTVFTKLFLLN